MLFSIVSPASSLSVAIKSMSKLHSYSNVTHMYDVNGDTMATPSTDVPQTCTSICSIPLLYPTALSPLSLLSPSCLFSVLSLSVSRYFYPPLSPLSLLVAVVTYFIVGALTNYFHLGARGVEVIPQYTFWKDVPFLIKVSLWAYYT